MNRTRVFGIMGLIVFAVLLGSLGPQTTVAQGDTGVLTIHVLDSINKNPIAGAEVTYDNGTDTTDAAGEVVFTDVEWGAVEVHVDATGYQVKTETVAVNAWMVVKAIQLLPVSSAPSPALIVMASVMALAVIALAIIRRH